MRQTGLLELEDGGRYAGRLQGCPKPVRGEVVFNTGMVGYTEALTDPSYSGQILVLTYPLVGNYGVPPHFESRRIHAAGLVVSELAADYSHARAQKSLPQWLREQGIPCLSGVDTRALTKHLRHRGCMPGRITGADGEVAGEDAASGVAAVSTPRRQMLEGGRRVVVLVDCGAKASIVEELRARELTVVRVPWDYDFLREDFDALLLSNGPGDPTDCAPTIRHVARALELGKPVMGICLGHQLLALAAGASTYRLKFGHRGHNQPCIEAGGAQAGSGRCYITSQNHGYAVDAATLPRGWEPWFTNANDGSNEGMRHRSKPFLSVQFHPEAAPGPVDSRSLFDHFVALIP
jgi:carbamoyl-phosphate synthase small subunit